MTKRKKNNQKNYYDRKGTITLIKIEDGEKVWVQDKFSKT